MRKQLVGGEQVISIRMSDELVVWLDREAEKRTKKEPGAVFSRSTVARMFLMEAMRRARSAARR